MTLCDVRHEAGPEADDLVAEIAGLANQVVPVLESVTGLPVGPRPVIRVITPDAWVAAMIAEELRAAQLDIADLDLTPDQEQQLLARPQTQEDDYRLIWPLVMGATVVAPDGTPQVLLMPEALSHCGFEKPEKIKVLAHELTHVGQHQAGDGAAFIAPRSAYATLRGLDKAAATFLLEGHARWADLEVTTRMIGREVDENTGRQSAQWKEVIEQVSERYGSDPNSAPGASMAAYTQGSQWVRTAVATVGTGVLNRIWKDLTLMPTAVELEDHRAWIARVG